MKNLNLKSSEDVENTFRLFSISFEHSLKFLEIVQKRFIKRLTVFKKN